MTVPFRTTMGIGSLGSQSVSIKRKFRWTLGITRDCDNSLIPEHYVKLASRPNITIEETELNFLNGKTWIPGKGTWETITVTYYDVGGSGLTQDNRELFNWLSSVYGFQDVRTLQNSKTSQYTGTGTLILWDGCGQAMEQWVLRGMWPQSINFGELDYASSEECTIELTMRYTSVEYQSYCPGFTPQGCPCVVC